MNATRCGSGGMVCTLSVLFFPFLTLAEPGSEPGSAKLALIAYKANHGDISRAYKCKFTMTVSIADSAEKAFAGELRGRDSCDFEIVVRGDEKKLITLTDLSSRFKAPKEGNRTNMSSFGPVKDISFGTTGLRVVDMWRQASINQFDAEDANVGPFVVAGSDLLGIVTRELEANRAIMSENGIQERDGVPKISVGFSHWPGNRYQFWFDPSRGYLPTEGRHSFCHQDGKKMNDWEVRVLEAKDIGGGKWFPMTVIRVTIPLKGPCTVQQCRVTDLVVGKVSDEDLEFEVSAGTTILMDVPDQKQPPYIKLRQDESLGPKDIARLKDMLNRKRNDPLMDTAVKSYEDTGRRKWYWIGGAALALLLMALSGRRWYRRRHGW